MTGGAREKEQPTFVAKPGAVRREPLAQPQREEEDARMEIPAFLRRQAN